MTLPFHSSFYLTPESLEDSYASRQLLVQIIDTEVKTELRQWLREDYFRGQFDATALPIVGLYAYRRYAPVVETLRTNCCMDDINEDIALAQRPLAPLLVDIIVGAIQWTVDDLYPAADTVERLCGFMGEVLSPVKNLDGMRLHLKDVSNDEAQDLHRIASAFYPLLKPYVTARYSGDWDFQAFDRKKLLCDAERVATSFSTSLKSFLEAIDEGFFL